MRYISMALMSYKLMDFVSVALRLQSNEAAHRKSESQWKPQTEQWKRLSLRLNAEQEKTRIVARGHIVDHKQTARRNVKLGYFSPGKSDWREKPIRRAEPKQMPLSAVTRLTTNTRRI